MSQCCVDFQIENYFPCEAIQSEKELYPDFVMLRWQSPWTLFSMLKVQRVGLPNQCWHMNKNDWEHLPASHTKMYTLISRCCVDFPFGNFFLCSSFKGYNPQIHVDVLTIWIVSTSHQNRKQNISLFCDAMLAISLDTILHVQGSRGMTPKSVLTCWDSWLTELATKPL